MHSGASACTKHPCLCPGDGRARQADAHRAGRQPTRPPGPASLAPSDSPLAASISRPSRPLRGKVLISSSRVSSCISCPGPATSVRPFVRLLALNVHIVLVLAATCLPHYCSTDTSQEGQTCLVMSVNPARSLWHARVSPAKVHRGSRTRVHGDQRRSTAVESRRSPASQSSRYPGSTGRAGRTQRDGRNCAGPVQTLVRTDARSERGACGACEACGAAFDGNRAARSRTEGEGCVCRRAQAAFAVFTVASTL